MLNASSIRGLAVYWLFFAILLQVPIAADAQTTKPNIILVLADDIGKNVPGCYGSTEYSTPNLDRMAQGGMRFSQCFSSPYCSPSRIALLTGKYNFRNYYRWGVLEKSEKTIANAFQNAGYKTACYGKWQCDGGDEAIRSFGFSNYTIWQPYQDSFTGHRHKDPTTYKDGKYYKARSNKGKFGEDIFNDSVLNFIETNKANPFFIYYSMVLAHTPYQPTPDDPVYTSWDPNLNDGKYFKSMVKYMDKKIGLIIEKLKSLGLENNTIILFVGDNGTPILADNTGDDDATEGKGSTTDAGTHVPLIAYCPGTIQAGAVNDNLIDFTDFLPTLTEIANIPPLNNVDTRDGVSFAPAMLGQNGTKRDWVFNHFSTVLGLQRWAQTTTYKLYDSLGRFSFYNVQKDPLEKDTLPLNALSNIEQQIRQQLKEVLDRYASLSAPFLDNALSLNITDSSALLGARIIKAGDFTSVIERGTCYSLEGGKAFRSRYLINALKEGRHKMARFEHLRTGLQPETLYYFKGYAANKNGIGVSPISSFYTLSKGVIAPSSFFAACGNESFIDLSWSSAEYPTTGATNAGYLVVYAVETPLLVSSPNGKAPHEIVRKGQLLFDSSTVLPGLPQTSIRIPNLKDETAYTFLLVPYTWDGKHAGTYNYCISGAKMASAVAGQSMIY